jgi:hypothetical protein
MPFNQIIDLNTSGNVGRNSYEILLMSTNVIDVATTTAGPTPATLLEQITLPPGYLRVGDCLRASVQAEIISGNLTAEFVVTCSGFEIAIAYLDTVTTGNSAGTTIGHANILRPNTAIPQPGDALFSFQRSRTPNALLPFGDVQTLGQFSLLTTLNTRVPITIGLRGEILGSTGPCRARCAFYCVEVLRRAN